MPREAIEERRTLAEAMSLSTFIRGSYSFLSKSIISSIKVLNVSHINTRAIVIMIMADSAKESLSQIERPKEISPKISIILALLSVFIV